MTDTTLRMTWTLHISGLLTEDEKWTIVRNLREHVYHEREADIPGFAKITRVVTVTSDGVEHREKTDAEMYTELLAKKNTKADKRKAAVLKFMRGENKH